MRRSLCFASVALLAAAGCGDIIGFGGYTVDSGQGQLDAAGDGTGTDTGVKPDAPIDGATGDAADTGIPDAPGECTPKMEDCTNGVDDDCNGLADCMDPACTTGYSCAPPLPAMWSWAIYDQNMRPMCPTGFGTPKDVQEGIMASPATCGCGCSTTQPGCTNGNLNITAGTNGSCDDITNQNRPAAGGCQNLANFTTSNAQVKATGPSPSGGSCAAQPSKSVPAVSYQFQGRTCGYSGMLGGGCTMGNVCLPKAAPYTACVSKTGMNACPMGFSVQHLTGSMIMDTRDCSSCTCTFAAGTCGGTLTLYTDGSCTQNAENVTVNGQCQNVANRTWDRYRYTPTTNATCTASNVNATGTVVFSDLATVCCTN